MATVRNYGIDLLRLVSMFFVVVLHALGQSGILMASEESWAYRAGWFLAIFCFGAVNMFALISGYVGFREERRPLKWKGLIRLWAQAVFYGVGIFALVMIFDHDVAAGDTLFSHMAPILHGRYWYLTAYALLFCVTPLLNAGLRELSEKQCRKAIWAALIVISLIFFTGGEVFLLSGGYSAWWLMVLYFIGGAMKKGKFLEELNGRWCVFGIVALTIVTWITKVYCADAKVLDFVLAKGFMVSFTSPTIVFASILFVRLFISLRITRERSIKLIEWAAPCAFAVYLINTNYYVFEHYQKVWLNHITSMSTYVAVPALVGYVVVFFVMAIVIEKGRQVMILVLDKQLSLKGKKDAKDKSIAA